MVIKKKIVVFGSGSFGTAIANYLACVHGECLIYSRNNQVVHEINYEHKNSYFLGDILLNNNLVATNEINEIKDADIIIIAIPSKSFKDVINKIIKENINQETVFLVATKGLVDGPVELISQYLANQNITKTAFLGGPNFATEIALAKNASMTIATEENDIAIMLEEVFASKTLNISLTDDIVTQQIAGIVKNIIAIKSGILLAEEQGENARAALITDGLNEIVTIAGKLGGRLETILYPSVIGDLILTGYSATSRNTRFGYEFQRHNFSNEFISNYPVLVEGIESARKILKLADFNKKELPIIYDNVRLIQ